MTCSETYVVQAGDWLSRIANRTWGDPMMYPAIVETTNQMHTSDSSFAQIADPNQIEVGWKLCIPSPDAAKALLGRK